MGPWQERLLVPALVVAGSAIAAYAAVVDLRLLLLLTLPGVAYLVTAKSIARLAFIVGGGMLVLQSENTESKIAYAAGAAIFLVVALTRVPKSMRTRAEIAAFRPVFYGGFAVLTLVVVSFFVASSHGVGTVPWFRAALPYALLGTLPIVGLEVAIDSSRESVTRMFVFFTAIAPISFMVSFLDRRGISTLPIGQFAITSIALCAALLGYSLAQVATGGRRSVWFVAAVYVPLAVLLSGTRSGLALFAGVGGVIGHPRKMRLPAAKVAAVTAALGFALWILVPLIGSKLTSTPDFYSRRFASIPALLGSDDPAAADQSLDLRAIQSRVLREAFSESPVFGQGPGKLYEGITALDTPVAILAYFGIFGIVVLIWYAILWYRSIARLREITSHTSATAAFRVFVFTLVGYFPLGLVTDDKGLALALCLFVALMASTSVDTPEETATDVGVSELDLKPLPQADVARMKGRKIVRARGET